MASIQSVTPEFLHAPSSSPLAQVASDLPSVPTCLPLPAYHLGARGMQLEGRACPVDSAPETIRHGFCPPLVLSRASSLHCVDTPGLCPFSVQRLSGCFPYQWFAAWTVSIALSCWTVLGVLQSSLWTVSSLCPHMAQGCTLGCTVWRHSSHPGGPTLMTSSPPTLLTS